MRRAAVGSSETVHPLPCGSLEELELDFLDWADEVELYRILEYPLLVSHLATRFFRLMLGEDKVVLPGLKSLSLSSVAFWGASAEDARF